MSDIAKQLKSLGIEIQSYKTRRSQAEGSIETNLKRLVTEFKIKTTDEAKVRLKRLDKQIKRSEKDLQTKFTKLQEKYEW